MEGWLGWTTITRAELEAAQKAAEQGDRTVRDEIGIAAIHFLYSERFFPGTSVQLTRLRYIFFVAAIYEKLRRAAVPANFDLTISQIERHTAFQLCDRYKRRSQSLEGSGIIGWTVIDSHAPVLLPSMSYWTPLARWGLLANVPGGEKPPSRAAVHADWDRYRRRRPRGELDTQSELFSRELEIHWERGVPGDLGHIGERGRPLTFELTAWEVSLMRDRLSRLTSQSDKHRPLLAHLADLSADNLVKASRSAHLWDSTVVSSLPPNHPERDVIKRARCAAYLVQIARAIYDVLVAKIVRDVDRKPIGNEWYDAASAHLYSLSDRSSPEAQLGKSLDLTKVQNDAAEAQQNLDRQLVDLLKSVQTWLAADSRDPQNLLVKMREREWHKKKKRARLIVSAEERRRDWKFSPAQPLDYRWRVSAQLLSDLIGINS